MLLTQYTLVSVSERLSCLLSGMMGWWRPPSVCVKAARLQSDWPAQPNSFQSSSGYNSHMEPLCSLLPHSHFPSLLWELWWRRKMRFELSPLSLSISLQALAVWGERKHFGVFQSGSAYCESLRGMVDVRANGYNHFMYCKVWNRPPQARQLNLELGFLRSFSTVIISLWWHERIVSW